MIYLFILLFSFYLNASKAENLSDFQIGGFSLNESLLDKYTEQFLPDVPELDYSKIDVRTSIKTVKDFFHTIIILIFCNRDPMFGGVFLWFLTIISACNFMGEINFLCIGKSMVIYRFMTSLGVLPRSEISRLTRLSIRMSLLASMYTLRSNRDLSFG